MEYAVIYCDPPYPSANTTPYRYGEVDPAVYIPVLQAQKGAVAVSGYREEWSGLGWQCFERAALRRNVNGQRGRGWSGYG